MALNIGELVGYLKLDRSQWDRGVTAARAQLRRLGAGNEDLNALQGGFAAAGLGAVALAGKIAQIGGGLGLVVALVNVVTALSGGLGLAVAAGFAAAGAMIALKLGADGVQRAFDQLTPTLDTLKGEVSASFEQSLLPAVNNLKGILPQLTGGFKQIATAMGGVLTKVTLWMKTPAAISQTNTILSGTSRIIQNVGAALAPVIAAFVRLGSIAVPYLVQLTSGIGAAAERFNAWVQRMADSGNVDQWIQTAIETFRELGAIIGDVVAIVRAVFGALEDSGLGLGGTLGMVTGEVRAFLESAEGHDVLVALAQAVGTVSGVVGTILHTALVSLAPLLPPLLSAFATLATQVLPLVTGAVQFLAPILLNIANFIQQNISWIGPLAIALGVWTAAQWLLNVALNANPIGLFILAVGALIAIVATIITYWQPIVDFFSNLWTTVRDFFVGIWNEIWGFLSGIWAQISDTVSGVFTGIRDFFVNVWTDIVSWVRNSASNIWSAISGGVSNAYNAVVDWLGRAVNWVAGLPGRILGALGDFGSLLFNAGGDLIRGLWNGISNVADWLYSKISGFVSGVVDKIKSFFGIASPSKVMAAEVGRWLPAGVAQGIDDNTRVVSVSASRLAELATRNAAAILKASPVVQPITGLGDLVKSGGVSQQMWDQLLAAGWRGRAGDSMEALYRPDTEQRSLVHIENYHPPANASAADVAADLDWFSKTGG